ncbi:ATP-dependent protease La [Sphaeroforma arctica JP610]|uniref:Lon protease homolog n=1 Tax=Sphaeroforma arctica JP610 TaxID=667725 RepID=A0A0L0FPP5_9EUKA|nr:ATP-dependent protease La [Sphaeroforma arctica JP610]KNC78785.1 ATP-dependent protease La [Sphaeroforma arctica JP610]|eukprot:XP_014152687.1 ATP-dependent protease La [Sphaeroforma arctica JP610]
MDSGDAISTTILQDGDVPAEVPKVIAIAFSNPVFPHFSTNGVFKQEGMMDELLVISESSSPYVGVFMAKDPDRRDPNQLDMCAADLFPVGTLCMLDDVVLQHGNAHVSLTPLRRIRIVERERFDAAKSLLTVHQSTETDKGNGKESDVLSSTTSESVSSTFPQEVESKDTAKDEVGEEAAVDKSETVADITEKESAEAATLTNSGPDEDKPAEKPFIYVNVVNVVDEPYDKDDSMLKGTQDALVECLREAMSRSQYVSDLVMTQVPRLNTDIMLAPGLLADFVGSFGFHDPGESQKLLEETNIRERVHLALMLLKKEMVALTLAAQIQSEVQDDYMNTQRRYMLQQQLSKIKKELGLERDDKEAVVEKFQNRLKQLHVPEEVDQVVKQEMQKLQYLDSHSQEFGVTRSYLDWLTQIPYGLQSDDVFDLVAAKTVLDKDHFGLDDVKERILEFIAVSKMRGPGHTAGKIICLCGPPGVGKTSIASSIAESLGRKYFRFSVGGMYDVAEIKGHRRTYVGAMPGKIIQGLKLTQTENPLILIDEIDKIGRGHTGDPSSALLELLDPEQNKAYVDHYLDVPTDLSKVLFVCTANVTDTIPVPLLDRMEVIRLSGYVTQEKLEIAKRHLIPAARDTTGTSTSETVIADEAVEELIKHYTRENGVRGLQKQIEKVHRKLALRMVRGTEDKVAISSENIRDYVGKELYADPKLYQTTTPVGVVMGLAWTAMGGAVLYVESALADGMGHGKSTKNQDSTDTAHDDSGSGRLLTTGRLGETMGESAKIGYTYAKNFLHGLDAQNRFFQNHAVHVHVAEGAVPKDGPSAGVTFVSSLLSLALDRPLRADTSMTGEVSLTGKILRVGGIKEKLIAARAADVTTVIFPEGNRADVDGLADYLKEGVQIHFASEYDDVYRVAFADNEQST